MNSSSLNHAKVLAWEYWANSWLQFLFGFAISLALTMFVYGILATVQGTQGWGAESSFGQLDVSKHGPEGVQMQFGFFWLVLSMAASSVIPALGKPAHRYRTPSSSALLVGIPLICSVVATFIMYVGVALTLNRLFAANWLIGVPTLFAMAAVAWMQAVYWSTCNSKGLLATAGLFSTVIIIAMAGYGMLIGGTRPFLLTELSPARIFGFVVTIGSSFAIATFGFSRLRHGGGIPAKQFADWLIDRIPTSRSQTPFSTAMSAQLWYEFRHRGFVLPMLAVAASGSVAVASAFGEEAVRITLGIGAVVLAICIPTFGMYFGPRKSNGQFGHFFGSRPLTDTQFADAVLKNVTISYVLTSVVWGMTSGIVYLAFIKDEQFLEKNFHGPSASELFSFFVMWLLGWAALGLITSITLGGRRFATRALTVIVGLAFCIVANTWVVDKSTYDRCACLFAAMVTATVVAGFIHAYRVNLIGVPRLLLAVVPMTVAAAAIHFPSRHDLLTIAIFATMASFISLPLATAPLAVWWNRHQ